MRSASEQHSHVLSQCAKAYVKNSTGSLHTDGQWDLGKHHACCQLRRRCHLQDHSFDLPWALSAVQAGVRSHALHSAPEQHSHVLLQYAKVYLKKSSRQLRRQRRLQDHTFDSP